MITNIYHFLRASLRAATRLSAVALCAAVTLAGGTALFTSCSTDDLTTATPGDNFPKDGRVRISTSVETPTSSVITRADGGTTTLYTGKTLGLFVDYGYTPATDGSDGTSSVEDTYNRFNVKYTQDGSGSWAQDLTAADYAGLTTPALWKNTSEEVKTVWAYGPYQESTRPTVEQSGLNTDVENNRSVIFNIPEDQTDGIDKADLVSGAKSSFNPYTGLTPAKAVDITLKHRLVKLTVALTLGDQFDGVKTDNGEDIAVASMTLHKNPSAVMLKLGDETSFYVHDSDYFDKDIQMHLTTVTTTEGTTEKPAFEAIGNFWTNSGTKLLTLKLNNGRSYTYTITDGVYYEFESAIRISGFLGHAFLLNLKVGKDKLEIADGTDAVTVVDWDDNSGAGNVIPGGEAEERWDISNVDATSMTSTPSSPPM